MLLRYANKHTDILQRMLINIFVRKDNDFSVFELTFICSSAKIT